MSLQSEQKQQAHESPPLDEEIQLSYNFVSRMLYEVITAAGFHPVVDGEGVVDHFRHGAVMPEETVRHAQGIQGVFHVRHTADQVGAASPHHHEQRHRATLVEKRPQAVGHGAERLINIRIRNNFV